MLYRKYGSTGIEVSAIGFGGMRFEDQSDVEACAGLVKAAYDKGINYFDTAPGYEKSEDLFGAALKEMQKTRGERPFYCSTKSDKAEPAEIRRELERSLERMNLDYIDFYHVWCVMTPEEYYKRKRKGAIREFERLKEQGLIRHICISTHANSEEMDKILRNELCTSCNYCCDKCPEGISVAKMMDVYNHLVLAEKKIEMINRLRWHWGIPLEDNTIDKCTECGICEQLCTQKLPIRERLKIIQSEVEKFLKESKGK